MAYAVGIDLGGTSARAAVVDSQGRILASRKREHPDTDPAKIADLLQTSAQEALSEAGLRESEVVAVGVGAAGQIHSGTGVIAVGPNLGWRKVPFAELLRARLPWPVLLMNDLSAAAYGERAVGAGQGAADVLLVFVGSGIGSALILAGRLYEGAAGVAGELGHTKVVPGGRRCGCGEQGCLEAYCGGRALSEQVAEALAADRTSQLASVAVGGRRVNAMEIEQAAMAGDSLARELWENCGRLLPLSVANYVAVLNPARVILGGGVLTAAPKLKEIVRERALQLAPAAAREGLQIVDARLGDDAGVVGAALRALSAQEARHG